MAEPMINAPKALKASSTIWFIGGSSLARPRQSKPAVPLLEGEIWEKIGPTVLRHSGGGGDYHVVGLVAVRAGDLGDRISCGTCSGIAEGLTPVLAMTAKQKSRIVGGRLATLTAKRCEARPRSASSRQGRGTVAHRPGDRYRLIPKAIDAQRAAAKTASPNGTGLKTRVS